MPVTTKRFVLQIAIAAAMLVAANALIARMARNSVPRQLIRTIDNFPNATLLASGNSLMAAAFDEPTFQKSWEAEPPASMKVKPLNIALGASGTVEQLLLLRHAFAVNPNANIIVYGFFNQQLTEIPTGGWNDLTGNRAMSYYVEPYFAADIYAPESRLQLLQIGIIGHVPMLVERLTLWAKVEKVRRKLEEIGLPHERTTVFGRAGDFRAMEISDTAAFLKSCQQIADQKLPFTPSVEQMIQATRARHAAFVIVEMPMPSAHIAKYYNTAEWRAYEAHLLELSNAKGAMFINAGDWLKDEEFADDLHVNEAGRVDFSSRLAEKLKPLLGQQHE